MCDEWILHSCFLFSGVCFTPLAWCWRRRGNKRVIRQMCVCVQSCRLCRGSGFQTGDAGSRSDSQTGGHVADQAQLSHGEASVLFNQEKDDEWDKGLSSGENSYPETNLWVCHLSRCFKQSVKCLISPVTIWTSSSLQTNAGVKVWEGRSEKMLNNENPKTEMNVSRKWEIKFIKAEPATTARLRKQVWVSSAIEDVNRPGALLNESLWSSNKYNKPVWFQSLRVRNTDMFPPPPAG